MKYAAYTVTTELDGEYAWFDKVVVACEEMPTKTMLNLLTEREPPYVSDNDRLHDLLLANILNPHKEKVAHDEYNTWLLGMKEVTETYMLYYGRDSAYEIEFIRHLTPEEVATYNTVQSYWEQPITPRG